MKPRSRQITMPEPTAEDRFKPLNQPERVVSPYAKIEYDRAVAKNATLPRGQKKTLPQAPIVGSRIYGTNQYVQPSNPIIDTLTKMGRQDSGPLSNKEYRGASVDAQNRAAANQFVIGLSKLAQAQRRDNNSFNLGMLGIKQRGMESDRNYGLAARAQQIQQDQFGSNFAQRSIESDRNYELAVAEARRAAQPGVRPMNEYDFARLDADHIENVNKILSGPGRDAFLGTKYKDLNTTEQQKALDYVYENARPPQYEKVPKTSWLSSTRYRVADDGWGGERYSPAQHQRGNILAADTAMQQEQNASIDYISRAVTRKRHDATPEEIEAFRKLEMEQQNAK